MIIEESANTNGVVDSLNDTYHHLAGRSLETGYFHEGPSSDAGDKHGGRVTHINPNMSHQDAVKMFGQHIEHHGGTAIRAHSHTSDPNKSLVVFHDGGLPQAATVESDGKGGHKMTVVKVW